MADLDLLQYLFRLRDRWVLPQAIAAELGGRTEVIHREVETLLREGYAVEYHPAYGYRFRPGADLLDPHRIREGLEPSFVGLEIHSLREVTSTMDVAWALAGEGRPSGTVVLAESQRKGRGRFGRPWRSPGGGGLWMSIILRGGVVPRPPSMLTVASAIAVVEAVEGRSALPARIRWPNDIVVHEKKAGGILIEMKQEGDKPPTVVLGIGLNVGLSPADLPAPLETVATSLSAEGTREADRTALARAILASLDTWCGRLAAREIGLLRERWRALSTNLGKRAAVEQEGERFEGVVVDLDPIQGLSLDLGGGEIRTFPSEQVTLLPT